MPFFLLLTLSACRQQKPQVIKWLHVRAEATLAEHSGDKDPPAATAGDKSKRLFSSKR